MTEQQQKWLDKKLEWIRQQIDSQWPLTDEQWEIVVDKAGEIIDSSKRNREVRDRIWDLLEEYDRKERDERNGRLLQSQHAKK